MLWALLLALCAGAAKSACSDYTACEACVVKSSMLGHRVGKRACLWSTQEGCSDPADPIAADTAVRWLNMDDAADVRAQAEAACKGVGVGQEVPVSELDLEVGPNYMSPSVAAWLDMDEVTGVSPCENALISYRETGVVDVAAACAGGRNRGCRAVGEQVMSRVKSPSGDLWRHKVEIVYRQQAPATARQFQKTGLDERAFAQTIHPGRFCSIDGTRMLREAWTTPTDAMPLFQERACAQTPKGSLVPDRCRPKRHAVLVTGNVEDGALTVNMLAQLTRTYATLTNPDELAFDPNDVVVMVTTDHMQYSQLGQSGTATISVRPERGAEQVAVRIKTDCSPHDRNMLGTRRGGVYKKGYICVDYTGYSVTSSNVVKVLQGKAPDCARPRTGYVFKKDKAVAETDFDFVCNRRTPKAGLWHDTFLYMHGHGAYDESQDLDARVYHAIFSSGRASISLADNDDFGSKDLKTVVASPYHRFVAIISACHSGGFATELEEMLMRDDASAMIITSSIPEQVTYSAALSLINPQNNLLTNEFGEFFLPEIQQVCQVAPGEVPDSRPVPHALQAVNAQANQSPYYKNIKGRRDEDHVVGFLLGSRNMMVTPMACLFCPDQSPALWQHLCIDKSADWSPSDEDPPTNPPFTLALKLPEGEKKGWEQTYEPSPYMFEEESSAAPANKTDGVGLGPDVMRLEADIAEMVGSMDG